MIRVHRPGVSCPRPRRGSVNEVGDEEVTAVIRLGEVSDCRVGDCEADRVGKFVRPTSAACGAVDPEAEVPGAISVERPGSCGQTGDVRINRDVSQRYTNPVELERLHVCSARLRECKPTG